MITLINGHVQNPAGLLVPKGSISFQLNVDGTVIAAPYGIVLAEQVVLFQLDASGNLVQPAQLYSNAELEPQNSRGLGTYYLVTFYDANGARLNKVPMWWQFPEAAGATVDISGMTPYMTGGGNVIYYPIVPLGGSGTVTSVGFEGDGVVFSPTLFGPITSAGTIVPTLLTQSAHTVLSGPTSGAAATPTFRLLVPSDIPAAGPVQAVQFNLGGVLGGDSQFTWNTSTETLTIGVPASSLSSWLQSFGAGAQQFFTQNSISTAASNPSTICHSIYIDQRQDDIVAVSIFHDTTNFPAMTATTTFNVNQNLIKGPLTSTAIFGIQSLSGNLNLGNVWCYQASIQDDGITGGTINTIIGYHCETFPATATTQNCYQFNADSHTGNLNVGTVLNAAYHAGGTITDDGHSYGVYIESGSNYFGAPAATAAVKIVNPTAATSLVNQNSPALTFTGNYWTGSASANDTWKIQAVEAVDTNGSNSVLTLSHSGQAASTVSLGVAGSSLSAVLQHYQAGAVEGFAFNFISNATTNPSTFPYTVFIQQNQDQCLGVQIYQDATAQNHPSAVFPLTSAPLVTTSLLAASTMVTGVFSAPRFVGALDCGTIAGYQASLEDNTVPCTGNINTLYGYHAEFSTAATVQRAICFNADEVNGNLNQGVAFNAVFYSGLVTDDGHSYTLYTKAGRASVGGPLEFRGSTSGTAVIQVAAIAGTPNPLQLPISTGTSGQVLTTNGANPQQLSWGSISAIAGNLTTGQLPTAGVTAGPFTSITSIQTTNGLVTTLTGTSDERLKTDIRPFARGLDAIMALHPATYKWNEAGQIKTGFSAEQEFSGFIAQDLQKAIPEAVGQEGEYLNVADRPVLAALVNAVQEQQRMIADLRREIAALRK